MRLRTLVADESLRAPPIALYPAWGVVTVESGQAGGREQTGKPAPTTGLPIDQLVKELVSRASEVVDLQDRLQGLLHVSRLIASELSLDRVLERIVEVARATVDAQYAALGVIGADGNLDRFIHTGMDPDTVQSIGHLPEGHGLLGALITNPVPIRLTNIADDPRSIGFPADHPPMSSFLGVPIGGHDGIFGNLYLCNRLATSSPPRTRRWCWPWRRRRVSRSRTLESTRSHGDARPG